MLETCTSKSVPGSPQVIPEFLHNAQLTSKQKSSSSMKLFRRLSFTSISSHSAVSSSPIPDSSSTLENSPDDLVVDDYTSEGSSSRTTLSSSPNATTISSRDHSIRGSSVFGTPQNLLDTPDSLGTSPSTSSRRVSSLRRNSTSKQSRGPGIADFKHLEAELPRFMSKNGVHKANVLRLVLLSFLRQQKGLAPGSASCLSPTCLNGPRDVSPTLTQLYKTKVLQKWWSNILLTFKNRSIMGADRSAFLEAISGLLTRPEWADDLSQYQELLFETLNLAISKLNLKNVPLAVSAFSGKVLAYSFFFIPGVAPCLINILDVAPRQVDRIIACSFEQESVDWFNTGQDPGSDDSDSEDSFSDEPLPTLPLAVTDIKPLFADHLHCTMGYCGGTKIDMPLVTETRLQFMYGPWNRRWACYSSDLFMAFIKHYYSIISITFNQAPGFSLKPWNSHLAAPGLVVFHAFILCELDKVAIKPDVKTTRFNNDYDAVAVNAIPAMGKRRVDQLKFLATIREILHNDDSTIQYYERYCRQFENILRAVALSIRLYDMENCVVLTDLAEEYISSLIMLQPSTRQQVQIFKDRAIDWAFWISVAEKMLASENTNTELRALSFLFNIWDHIPLGIGATGEARRGRRANRTSLTLGVEDRFGLYFDDHEGLRWKCTSWLLSMDMWKRYFCHWQPLVRSYYHRLLVWRVASVGPESDLLCSILFSNYNSDVRKLLSRRLRLSVSKVQKMVVSGVNVSLNPCLPIVHRRLSIVLNPASNVTGSAPLTLNGSLISPETADVIPGVISAPTHIRPPFSHRPGAPINGLGPPLLTNGGKTDAFDVFDDIAYSYGPLPQQKPVGIGSSTGSSADTRDSLETIRVSPEKKKLSRVESLTALFRRSSKKERAKTKTLSEQHKQNSLPSISSMAENNGLARRHYSTSNLRSGHSLPATIHSSPDTISLNSIPELNDGVASPTRPRASPNGMAESLTMALIPPPPRLTRKTPEIVRPIYKFALEHSETSVRRQMDLIRGVPGIKNRPLDEVDAEKALQKLGTIARLPFDYCRTDSQSESVLDFYGDEEDDPLTSFGMGVALTIDSNSGESLYLSPLTSPTPGKSQSPAARKDEETIIQPTLDHDEVRFWKYSGSSLAEWELCVAEFEEFIRSSKILSGVSRLEDIKVPFLVAEIPNRAFGG